MSKLIQSTENLDSTTQKIKKTVNDIAHSFNYIGLLLWEVRENKYYLERNYKDVYEYAEKELMFKKTSTHNFISITEKFSLKTKSGYPTLALSDKYDKYNYTQLTEMLSIKAVDPADVVSPDMSVKKIREVKKELKNNIVDVDFTEIQSTEFGDQIDIIEIVESKDFIKVTASVDSILKQRILDYINSRIVTMKDLYKNAGKDIEMKYKCQGQLDALQGLYEEIYHDFERNPFFE